MACRPPWLDKENVEKPVLLYVDAHTSHLSLPFMKLCTEKHIACVCVWANEIGHTPLWSNKLFFHHTRTESSSFRSFFSSESSQFQSCAKIYKTADFSIPRDESSLHCIPSDGKFNQKWASSKYTITSNWVNAYIN